MSKYTGTYLNLAQEGKEGYQIDIILDDGKFCYDKEGRKYTYAQLDFNFERIQAPMYSPEVMNELKAIGGEMFGTSKRPSNSVNEVVNPTVIHKQNSAPTVETKQEKVEVIIDSNEVSTHYGSQDLQNFIAIAVKNSRKKGNNSQLNINLTINFDFDIEKVIGSAAEICESEKDEDIVNEILNYSDLKLSAIKSAIVKTLLKPEE